MSVYLIYLYLIFGIVPFILLVWNFFRKNIQAYHIFPMTCLIFFASLFEYYVLNYGYTTAVFSRIYMVLEFIAIFFFFSFYSKHKILRWLFLVSFIIVYLVNLAMWKGEETMHGDAYLVFIETLFVIVFSFLWFRNVFIHDHEMKYLESSHFYFISGLIIYFSGAFCLLLLSDYILKNMQSEYESYININLTFNLIFRILLLLSIWKNQRK